VFESRYGEVVMKSDPAYRIPPGVREAIRAFLKRGPKEARPFAASEANSAARRVFLDPSISDTALMDAIKSPSTETQRRIEKLAQRRAKETKDRNELI
jgi:hypothetical protein